MNKYILLIVLLFLGSGRIAAQSVTVDAKIDSLQILIGEQAKVQLQVAMDAKQRAVFPSFTDTLVRGVILLLMVEFLIKTGDRKSTRLNSSHASKSRMPSSA